ncbi:MAG TPA: metallophosphoesterase family protein [Usitatibacter sp.]|nr:metallophosphoesterase family protein [Usitatibacter sp.]
MALYGILGDIHGNREALEAALAALDELGAERIACVGDIVGYNADPDACVEILAARRAACIAGNHDLIGTGMLGFERCSNKAMHSLKRTRRHLARPTAERLRRLPAHLVIEGDVVLTHGGIRDVQQYMTRPQHILENAALMRSDFPHACICFFGHTHEQRVFVTDGAEVHEPWSDALAGGNDVVASLEPGPLYFINPGSVDASRKRTTKVAEFALFDSTARTVRFGRVPYDAAATEAKARSGGFRIDRWRDRLYDVQRRLVGPRHDSV